MVLNISVSISDKALVDLLKNFTPEKADETIDALKDEIVTHVTSDISKTISGEFYKAFQKFGYELPKEKTSIDIDELAEYLREKQKVEITQSRPQTFQPTFTPIVGNPSEKTPH